MNNDALIEEIKIKIDYLRHIGANPDDISALIRFKRKLEAKDEIFSTETDIKNDLCEHKDSCDLM